MAEQLKNTLAFDLLSGATVIIPHGLQTILSTPLAPDIIFVPSELLEVTASDTVAVTLRNNGTVPQSGALLVESWHTIERAFGDEANKDLPVKPYIVVSDNADVPPSRNPMAPPEQWFVQIGFEGAETVPMATRVSQLGTGDIMAIRAGSIVGIRTRTQGPVATGFVTAIPTINGVPQPLLTSNVLAGQDNDGETVDSGLIPYIAGDRIGVQGSSPANLTPPGILMEVWLEVFEEL